MADDLSWSESLPNLAFLWAQSSLHATVVMAQAEVRGLILEQERHGQGEHIMWLAGRGRDEMVT